MSFPVSLHTSAQCLVRSIEVTTPGNVRPCPRPLIGQQGPMFLSRYRIDRASHQGRHSGRLVQPGNSGTSRDLGRSLLQRHHLRRKCTGSSREVPAAPVRGPVSNRAESALSLGPRQERPELAVRGGGQEVGTMSGRAG